jgi:hypothetical protein
MKQALEIVTYKLNDSVSDGAFMKASEDMERQFAAKQKGFVTRIVGMSDSGEWVDVVTWETMEDALAASEAAMKSPACAPMFAMIEESSIKMHHFAIM